jgi:hypothetical protein
VPYDDEIDRIVTSFGNFIEKMYFNEAGRLKLILRYLEFNPIYNDILRGAGITSVENLLKIPKLAVKCMEASNSLFDQTLKKLKAAS